MKIIRGEWGFWIGEWFFAEGTVLTVFLADLREGVYELNFISSKATFVLS